LAAEICARHKRATADAIVYATAQEQGADLLTCDAHFDGLPGVMFVAKINIRRPEFSEREAQRDRYFD